MNTTMVSLIHTHAALLYSSSPKYITSVCPTSNTFWYSTAKKRPSLCATRLSLLILSRSPPSITNGHSRQRSSMHQAFILSSTTRPSAMHPPRRDGLYSVRPHHQHRHRIGH